MITRNKIYQSVGYRNIQLAGIELCIVIAIICILAGLALNSFSPLPIRAMFTQMFSYLIPARRDIIVDYLVNGEWPESADPEKYLRGLAFLKINNVSIEDGNQDIKFRFNRYNLDTDYTLSIRRVSEKEAATFLWVCGYGNSAEGITVTVPDKTNVPEEILPHSCR